VVYVHIIMGLVAWIFARAGPGLARRLATINLQPYWLKSYDSTKVFTTLYT